MPFNKVILVGNMVADPELKKTNTGTSVVSFRIAVNRSYARQGEKPLTDFFNVTAWGQRAEFISRFFPIGRQILICGQLQNRSWTDNNGQNRTTTEIVVDEATFVGNKGTDGGFIPNGPQSPSDAPSYGSPQEEAFTDLSSDDELPF